MFVGHRRLICVLMTCIASVAGLCEVCVCEEKSLPPKEPNSFFALCMDTHDEKHRSMDEQNAMLAELGFDGVAHLWLDGLEERAESARRHGLRVTQVCMRVDLAAESEDAAFDSRLANVLPCVAGMETQLALLIYGGAPSDTSLDEYAKRIIQRIVDIAEPSGVHVVLYPHVGAWNERVADGVRVAEMFPEHNVSVMFNLCHWMAVEEEDSPEGTLEAAKPYLAAITINGSDTPAEIRAKTGNWLQSLDAGSYSLEPLMRILHRVNYRGPIGLQCYGIPGDASVHLERSMERWRELKPLISQQHN